MADDQVRLELESERTSALFQRVEDVYLPLCVAAAITFHQVHGNTKAIVSRSDYDDALNIATELRSTGETVGGLSIARRDLVSALSFVKRQGLAFALAAKDL